MWQIPTRPSATFQGLPPRVSGLHFPLDLLKATRRFADFRSGLPIEIRLSEPLVQLSLLRFERLDAFWQIVKLALLLVAQLTWLLRTTASVDAGLLWSSCCWHFPVAPGFIFF